MGTIGGISVELQIEIGKSYEVIGVGFCKMNKFPTTFTIEGYDPESNPRFPFYATDGKRFASNGKYNVLFPYAFDLVKEVDLGD